MTDKVKMSLERYEGLKQTIADLQAEVERWKDDYRILKTDLMGYEILLQKIGIPGEVIEGLNPDDICVLKHYDPMDMRDSIFIEIKNILPEKLMG